MCLLVIKMFPLPTSFQDKIAKTRYWPVEVFRTAIPAAAKGKKVSSIYTSKLV